MENGAEPFRLSQRYRTAFRKDFDCILRAKNNTWLPMVTQEEHPYLCKMLEEYQEALDTASKKLGEFLRSTKTKPNRRCYGPPY